MGWLDERGIDVECAVALGVKSCDRLGPDTIAFPYIRQGEIVNYKYRSFPDKRWCMDEGKPLCLWNGDVLMDRTLGTSPLVITEGELDGLIAIQTGYRRTVSVPNGSPPTHGHAYPWLEPYKGMLKEIAPKILATDGDPPGHNLLHDLALQLGRPSCKWLTYPVGKDLNDVWLEGGLPLVNRTINSARWVHVEGIYRLSELPPQPEIIAYDTGFPGLYRHYRIRLHDFTVVTGIPQMGKSSWLNDLACRCVKNHGWHVALASFEQSPHLDLKRNLRTWYGAKPVTHQSRSELDAADTWIDENFSLIVPNDDDEITMAWMRERIDTAILRCGARLIIIDPWNEMDLVPPHDLSPDISYTNYLGMVIREFKRIARRYLVHVIVAAHPAKLRADREGKLPMPTLYDIADTAHFANKPDVGIIIHRDENGDTLLKVAKSRYHDQIGRPGVIRLMFDSESAKFIVREDRLA